MLDSITTLAYSMFHNKGVYALLLGSGVSRAAGIPTGWEITLDLIRQVAVLAGEDAGSDPEAWLVGHGLHADYSQLLDKLAKTQAQRRAVLAGYIEPTEDERAEGLKAPTAAHRAIAELVRRGYIRVIITTNFDRLLEIALRDVGVEPTVVASDDAVKGAAPITHTQCTIIKIHGDYLDTRIKNTEAELASYPPDLDKLLDRVFDEFGLIVSGWSATWDPSLSGSLVRSPSRRYSTYWGLRGNATSEASAVIAHRGAEVVHVASADNFFEELESKIRALEEFSRPHPLSADMGVAMVKRHIVDESAKIKLNDLLEDTFEDAISRIPADMLDCNKWGQEEFVRRAAGYEAALGSLLPMVATGARWSEPRDEHLWLGIITRLLSLDSEASGATDAIDFRRYPAVLAFYAVGVGAVAGGRFGLLKEILRCRVRRARGDGYLTELLSLYTVASGGAQKLLPGQSNKKTPLSNHLEISLRGVLPRDVTAVNFEQTFDVFEILVALADIDRDNPGELPAGDKLYQIPVGRFIWRRRVIEELIEQLERDKTNPWMEAGFFSGSKDRTLALLRSLLEFSVKNGGF